MPFTTQPISETYTMSESESSFMAEIVYAYLATTIGPRSHRETHGWTHGYRDAIARILRRAYLHPSVAGAACIYVGRLKRRQPNLEVDGKAGLNMFIAALIVADKCIHDRSLARKAWPNVIGGVLTLPQISKLEIELLQGINWDTLLDKELCYDVQELGEGWWAMRRQRAFPVDFFVDKTWDGARPLAFDFFDGVSSDKTHRYSFAPHYTASGAQTPGYYRPAESIWTGINHGDDPPTLARRPRDACAPPSPPDSETNSSSSTSSDSESSSSANSGSNSDDDSSETESTLDSTPSKGDFVACLPSGEVITPCGPQPSPQAIDEVEDEHELPYSVEPTESGSFVTPPYYERRDDLPPVDWAAEVPPYTEEERRILGFKLRHPVPLKEFCVSALSLPCFYEKGDLVLETRVGKWQSKVPYGSRPCEIDAHPPGLTSVLMSEDPSSLGSFIIPTECSLDTVDDLPSVDWNVQPEHCGPEPSDKERRKLGLRATLAVPIIKKVVDYLAPANDLERGRRRKRRVQDWVGSVPIDVEDLQAIEMTRTLS